jgi:hypothetical protein
MKFILFRNGRRHSFGLIVSENDDTFTVAIMILCDEVGVGWRVENMPSLKFKATGLQIDKLLTGLQIDKLLVLHEILVIRKKYFDDGYLRFHIGMANIYFIADSNLGIYKNCFIISMFEKAKFPFSLPDIPDILKVHIDKCRIIGKLQHSLSNSEGHCHIYFSLPVSSATGNLFIKTYQPDNIITSIDSFKTREAELILHDAAYLDSLESKKHGWKIRTVAPLWILQSILSPNAIWVCFIYICIYVYMCVFIYTYIYTSKSISHRKIEIF